MFQQALQANPKTDKYNLNVKTQKSHFYNFENIKRVRGVLTERKRQRRFDRWCI